VIVAVLALIVTSVALLTPPDDGPRVRGVRLRLSEVSEPPNAIAYCYLLLKNYDKLQSMRMYNTCIITCYWKDLCKLYVLYINHHVNYILEFFNKLIDKCASVYSLHFVSGTLG